MSHAINPVAVTFAPTWFSKQYGMDFGEGFWTDPVERTEGFREQQRLLFERFADVNLGSADPGAGPNISQRYGNYFMPALFGCEIVYPKDQAPANLPLPDGSLEAMAGLEVPDFETNPVIQTGLWEARVLAEKYGACAGGINTGSPLNVAVNIYAEDFLMACATDPEVAQHVLRVIAETEFRLYREVSALIQPEGFPLDRMVFGYGNCPAVMLSPRVYREVVLPVDLWVREQVGDFYLHHCGVFDAYIDVYKPLNPTALDIGGGSDYRAIRQSYKETPFSLIVNAELVEQKRPREVGDFIGEMVEGASPAECISLLWTSELSAEVPDETVKAIATAHEAL